MQPQLFQTLLFQTSYILLLCSLFMFTLISETSKLSRPFRLTDSSNVKGEQAGGVMKGVVVASFFFWGVIGKDPLVVSSLLSVLSSSLLSSAVRAGSL